MNQQKLWSKNFISISMSNFFLFLTFYFLLVTLPNLALEKYHSSASEAGLMTTVFLFAAIISRPFAGQWLERIGYQKMLFVALIVFFGASILYFFPSSLYGILAVRFLQGIGFGMATTSAGTIVAEIVPSSRRGEGMGYFIMSSNLAMVLGPFVGISAMQQFGPTILFTLSVIGALASLIAGLFVKMTNPQEVHSNVKQPFTFRNIFEISAVSISLIGAFFGLVYSSILSFVSVYANEVHLGNVSNLFFVVFAIVLLISRPFTGKWFDSYGANIIVFPSIFLFAIGMFVLGKTDSEVTFLLSAGLIGLGWGTLFPTFQTIAVQDAPPKKRGLATATFLSIYDLGIGIGSFVVGLVIAKIGFSSFYLLCSIYILIGMALYYFVRVRKQQTSIPQVNNQKQ
ncbi:MULTISPECIES: MFS transporter [Neobacillus]|jgi:MFS family permease|uniref:MFS transporter n=1 Tax=Neobacillus TaxID=2675232 RepID=UPI0013D4E752|nr:MFS transporter [Neobacillus sedimentimangrovi]